MWSDDGTLARLWLHGAQVDEPLAYETYAGTTQPGTGTASELQADRQGSVLRVVEPATGQVAASYAYAAFGNRVATGPQAGTAQRYGYTGSEHDAESGLIHLRARAYDPGTGTFLQRDPIGFAGGDMNLYAYVGGDPFGASDPSGLAEVAMGRGGAGLSTAEWLLLSAELTAVGLSVEQAFQQGYDITFNDGFEASASGTALAPVGGSGVVGTISGGIGALVGNIMDSLLDHVDRWINEGPQTGVTPSAVGTGTGVDTGTTTGTSVVVRPHGNTKTNPRQQEIYYLRDRTDKSIQKVGLREVGQRRHSKRELAEGYVYLDKIQIVDGRALGLAVEAAHLAGYVATHGSIPPQQFRFGL